MLRIEKTTHKNNYSLINSKGSYWNLWLLSKSEHSLSHYSETWNPTLSYERNKAGDSISLQSKRNIDIKDCDLWFICDFSFLQANPGIPYNTDNIQIEIQPVMSDYEVELKSPDFPQTAGLSGGQSQLAALWLSLHCCPHSQWACLICSWPGSHNEGCSEFHCSSHQQVRWLEWQKRKLIQYKLLK